MAAVMVKQMNEIRRQEFRLGKDFLGTLIGRFFRRYLGLRP